MKLYKAAILIILAFSTAAAAEISCDPVTQKAHYNNSTGSWECRTDQTGGGGGAVFSVFGRTGDVVAAADDYSWTQIAAKPSTFPPDAHGHTEADVTNLVTDLGAKVPTSRRIDTTTPLQGGDNLTADRTFSILQAGSGQSGYLSSTHWSLFNEKESALTFSSPLSRSVNTITCPTCSVSGHAHAEADVTNLVTDLAGKSAVGHGHAEADVTSLVTDLAAKEATANKNVASGYAGLDASSKLTGAQQVYGTGANTAAQGNDSRITGAEQTANKNAASGYAGLDASSKLTGAQQVYGTGANTAAQGNDSRITGAEQTANKNVASGYAGLDASTKLAAAQLPNPGATTLGGVKSLTCSGTDKLSAIGTDGLPVCSTDQTGAGGSESEVIARTGGDVSNSTTTFADVTGLIFTASANKDYIFEAWLIFQSNTATTGIKFAVNGPASPVAVVMNAHIPIALTLYASDSMLASRAYDTGTPSVSVDTINANLLAHVVGIFRNGTTTGSFAIRFAAETTGTVKVMTGSILRYRQVN